MQNVTIIGPNLRDQSKGSFHVHATGCADINRRKYHGASKWDVEASTLEDVNDHVYDPGEFNCEPGEYLHDFHFAPCVKLENRS